MGWWWNGGLSAQWSTLWSDHAQPRWASHEPQPGWVPIPVLQARPSISPSYRVCLIEGNSLLVGHSGLSCWSSFASSILRGGKRLVSSASGLTCRPWHTGALRPSLSCFRLLQADSRPPRSQCWSPQKNHTTSCGKTSPLGNVDLRTLPKFILAHCRPVSLGLVSCPGTTVYLVLTNVRGDTSLGVGWRVLLQ